MKFKYVTLTVFVILLPMFIVDIMGQGASYFCKPLCPAGMLEGGIHLVRMNNSLQSAIGWLCAWIDPNAQAAAHALRFAKCRQPPFTTPTARNAYAAGFAKKTVPQGLSAWV